MTPHHVTLHGLYTTFYIPTTSHIHSSYQGPYTIQTSTIPPSAPSRYNAHLLLFRIAYVLSHFSTQPTHAPLLHTRFLICMLHKTVSVLFLSGSKRNTLGRQCTLRLRYVSCHNPIQECKRPCTHKVVVTGSVA